MGSRLSSPRRGGAGAEVVVPDVVDHVLRPPDEPEAAAAEDRAGPSGVGHGRRGRKRKKRSRRRKRLRMDNGDDEDARSSSASSSASAGASEDEEDEIERMLSTPKKRKLKTTSRYIYETLFESGSDSDVTVTALGREWKLHKLYLRQSDYFDSMFSGPWRESRESRVDIAIVDPNITEEALDVAFGSLYQDEVTIEPARAIPVLAAATLLQLGGLISQCEALMRESVNLATVLAFLRAGADYGAAALRRDCLAWMRVNLLSHLPEKPDALREVEAELMADLIGSPELFVMQTEVSAYVLLRLWLYLKLHPNFDGNPQDAVVTSHKYFQTRPKSSPFFLETAEGSCYSQVFRRLRLVHLINHHLDMQMLLSDRIIPHSWLEPVFRRQWQTLLKVDQGLDKGPEDVSPARFDRHCLRCGRTLTLGGQQHMWRWTGFNMGLDLIVTYDRHCISVKRNQGVAGGGGGGVSSGGGGGGHDHEALVDSRKRRAVKCRVAVASLNEQKQVTFYKRTEIQTLHLSRNASEVLMTLSPEEAKFPLLLSFNFMVTKPEEEEESGEGEQVEEEEDDEVEDVQH